jgi:hypothetical protein
MLKVQITAISGRLSGIELRPHWHCADSAFTQGRDFVNFKAIVIPCE